MKLEKQGKRYRESFKQSFISAIRTFDQQFSAFYLKSLGEKPALLTFLFHGIFQNPNEIAQHHVYPQQEVTTEHFRRFIEYFLNEGYDFVAPGQIPNELSNTGKDILITFDDGYFNNVHALPLLKEYKVPAIFYPFTQKVPCVFGLFPALSSNASDIFCHSLFVSFADSFRRGVGRSI